MLIKIEFPAKSFNKYSYIKFNEIPYVRCEFFHVDGQTEGRREKMELILNFRTFSNAPKNHTRI